jgi:hypothetical protein
VSDQDLRLALEALAADWRYNGGRKASEQLLDLLAAHPAEPALSKTVQYFLDQRGEYVRVLKQCVNADADYYRWQGHAEARRQLGEKLESAGVDLAAASQARPLPTRDELARAVDPDALDDAKKRSSHPAAVVQWAARKHMAYQAADAVLTLLNGGTK